jgi:hypothetical protein
MIIPTDLFPARFASSRLHANSQYYTMHSGDVE